MELMTNDDYQRAAIRMEQTANDMLALNPGHHTTYLAEAYKSIAWAYYRADSSNQRKMRVDFASLFEKFHEINQQEARNAD